jgi:hypothetical protein
LFTDRGKFNGEGFWNCKPGYSSQGGSALFQQSRQEKSWRAKRISARVDAAATGTAPTPVAASSANDMKFQFNFTVR